MKVLIKLVGSFMIAMAIYLMGVSFGMTLMVNAELGVSNTLLQELRGGLLSGLHSTTQHVVVFAVAGLGCLFLYCAENIKVKKRKSKKTRKSVKDFNPSGFDDYDL